MTGDRIESMEIKRAEFLLHSSVIHQYNEARERRFALLDRVHGDESLPYRVYMYSFPRDRARRIPIIRPRFLCKIGKSGPDFEGRVKAQFQLASGRYFTGLPEFPNIDTVVCVRNPLDFERFIREKIGKRQHPGGAGHEWFHSSHSELLRLWRRWRRHPEERKDVSDLLDEDAVMRQAGEPAGL